MELPDGRPLKVDGEVLVESTSGDGRLIMWLPGAQVGGFQHWDRVGPAAGASVIAFEGLCSVAAILTPARQRTGLGISNILRRAIQSKIEPSWKLPGGGSCERSGPRRTDLLLVWPQNEADTLDEARLRARWTTSKEIRRIGPDLALVLGVVSTPQENDTAAPTDLPPPIAPRELAAKALAEARQSGDRLREITALIDLAVSYLHKLDPQPAVSLLKEALDGAHQLGDEARKLDAMINLAQAALLLGRPDQAIEWLMPALDYARQTADRYTEKVALERLALAYRDRADHSRAVDHFEQALAIARSLGDAQHEAVLLWHAGIAYAELGRSDWALARGEEAVALLRQLGKPHAEEYARHLANYRARIPASSPVLRDEGFFGASVMTATPQIQTPTVAGPSMLRMALNATKAAATFVGSGFKTVTLDTYRARLAACTKCEMFTGIRCRVCGCISAAKARLPHENCPAAKWPS